MNNWFEVKVKYVKQLEDGRLKRVTEPYLIDAVSFAEAEERAFKEVGESVQGEFLIMGIAKREFADLFFYEDSDVWYKCKLTYMSTDEDSGKDKKVSINLLVTASSVKEAHERIKESLSSMTVSFEIPSIVKTNIEDVFPYSQEEQEY